MHNIVMMVNDNNIMKVPILCVRMHIIMHTISLESTYAYFIHTIYY